jgi:hypothetical protein
MMAQTETAKLNGSILAGRTLRHAERLDRLLTFRSGLGGTPCAS